ncbi:hypothetical protein BFJ63_vAg5334 [Fusarium oxysporum f. sp. narcissi]|uniref:Uncharacterized protein n=3 Tax=Fusarium oxysporum TaxID=5507 RepID=A0A420TKM3_FUSOX|nr:hypothetical protein BFJ65_g13756 [Fusarium oxysporum f. sp. cepae]RKK99373.1 hypothetical protein BFJ68_g13249 [Fusarium oxysporum]RYC91891.1 hypothetical protein BFJ63_vAg5334 [Fusarium oxysporum f. sp. narcissi]RKK55431.1 hypothetical protein BFJ67_g4212 [Fusarium oxysporum f. sp. cepae]RKK57153.1 hypothetical protein BFJ66_g3262 [Fusarium oxysporum f. sp. cepae]
MLGSKSFQNGWAKLLASLFFLLAASQLCTAAPYTTQLAVRDGQHLYSRVITPELDAYKRKLDASQAAGTYVGQDDTKFVDFTAAGDHVVGSSSFAGCFGVILATKQGTIVGHYNLDQAGLDNAKKEIPDLYSKHNDKVGGASAHLYSAVYYENGELVDGNLYNEYKKFLTDLIGSEPEDHHYTEAAETVPEEDLFEDKWDHDAVSGGFVVENSGGGGADTSIFFITIERQRTSAQLPDRR